MALAPWAREDAVVEALRKLPANDKVPENLRAAACWMLGLSGRPELVEEIRPWAEERSAWLDRAATAAIARLHGREDPNCLRWGAWLAPLPVALPDDSAR